eukprot:1464-Heterococcus_DN1.PRE.4
MYNGRVQRLLTAVNGHKLTLLHQHCASAIHQLQALCKRLAARYAARMHPFCYLDCASQCTSSDAAHTEHNALE